MVQNPKYLNKYILNAQSRHLVLKHYEIEFDQKKISNRFIVPLWLSAPSKY